jgi:hypothetical protein
VVFRLPLRQSSVCGRLGENGVVYLDVEVHLFHLSAPISVGAHHAGGKGETKFADIAIVSDKNGGIAPLCVRVGIETLVSIGKLTTTRPNGTPERSGVPRSPVGYRRGFYNDAAKASALRQAAKSTGQKVPAREF